MVEFLASSAIIFMVLVGWLYVQELYRRFAARHPRLGPFRSEATCQGSCGCHQGSCASGPHTVATGEVPADIAVQDGKFIQFKGAMK